MNVDRYTFLRRIGQGGFGTVSLYSDNFLDREVAIKSVRPVEGYDIANEYRLMSRVDSQHVVTIYDVSYQGDDLLIVEEFLSGESLTSMAGRLTYKRFLDVAYQISKGLADIHDVDVCHRDIKPENMKFDSEGILKIFDFGISVVGEDYETFNGRSTLNYAAPEIFMLSEGAESVPITKEYDIYSLGVSLWYLASGKLCNFNDFPPVVARLGPCVVADYSRIFPDMPRELVETLQRTLSANKTERPSAEELARLLLSEITKGQHRAKFIYPSGTWSLSNSRPVAGIGFPDCKFTVRYD
ncbi:MAG: serine/threonine-protein kinase, partial [Shewanella sp.]